MQSTLLRLRGSTVRVVVPLQSSVVAVTRGHATHAPPPGRKSRFPETASLERFLLRQKVMSLWRRILRDTCRIEDPKLRKETRETAKHEFVRNKDVKEVDKIKYFTATGKTEWEIASRYIDGL